MATVDDVRRILAEFPDRSPNRAELDSLRDFLEEMKAAGVAKTREYDLPRTDTIGRESKSASARSEVLPRK